MSVQWGELELLNATKVPHIALIDGARFFLAPPPSEDLELRLLILRSHYPPRRKIFDVKVCQSKRTRDHSVAHVNCRDAQKGRGIDVSCDKTRP
jgi:hypothetical protein